MALNKQILKTKIKNLLNGLKDEENQADAIEQFADELSTAIDDYVKEAEIIYTAGLVAPPLGGTVTGVFEGNLI
ncbi:MAG: hypothetical protein M9958_03185 [Chitinophagales bacterium]|nr:hypothetical protein [Chitinophagales bacterium]